MKQLLIMNRNIPTFKKFWKNLYCIMKYIIKFIYLLKFKYPSINIPSEKINIMSMKRTLSIDDLHISQEPNGTIFCLKLINCC